MPPVYINAVFLQHDSSAVANIESSSQTNDLAGLTVREGNYLKATADVGAFEHILTTDLLNHLVFVQKVFMKVISFCICKCLEVSNDLVPVMLRLSREDKVGLAILHPRSFDVAVLMLSGLWMLVHNIVVF